EPVEGPALLKRTGHLQVFKLAKHAPAAKLPEGERLEQRHVGDMAPDPFPGRVDVVERREFLGVHAAHISIDNKMAQQGPAVRKPWQKALKPLPFTIRAGRFLPSVSCRQLYCNL